MLHWQLQKLEDLTENDRQITYGVVKPGPEDPVDGVKFIRGGDIYDGRILAENLRTITADVSSSYRRTLLKGGELVVSLVGNPGHVAIVPGSLAGANLARQAGLVALRPDVDAHFVKYFLMSPLGRAELFSQMTGSVQVVINLANLRGVRVPLPPLPIQRRIAGILSAYDNLIENSQRRIKILEEMARRLYREWFVHFRFPGHEDCRFVESPLGEIPEGWEVKGLGEIADNFDRLRKPLSKIQRAELQGPYPYYGAAKVFDYVNDFIFDGEYLLMAEDGSVITSDRAPVLQLVNERFWPNNHTHVLRGRPPHSTHYLYLGLLCVDVSPYITGAAQPKITQENMNRIPFVSAAASVHKEFDDLIEPIIRQSQTLQWQISSLRRARDLLLPRLLSGQIDVEALPEPVLSES